MHEKNRALRVGDWKIVAAGAKSPWELYDMRTDRAESNDLASQQPEKVREMEEIWKTHTEEFRAGVSFRQDRPLRNRRASGRLKTITAVCQIRQAD